MVPRQEWGNSLDTVPWTQHHGYSLGSFIRIIELDPYCGDLAYVMAVDFKKGESTAHKGATHPIIPTPQSLIVAAVPQLQVKSVKGIDLPHDLKLRFKLI